MNLRYAGRSGFFAAILVALEQHGGCPEQGDPVTVSLSEQGYDGEIIVEITPDPEDEFMSDWEGSDETRFPARVRAAATVLRDRKCFGRYVVTHAKGLLTIVRAPW
jgi:hypothetical protein